MLIPGGPSEAFSGLSAIFWSRSGIKRRKRDPGPISLNLLTHLGRFNEQSSRKHPKKRLQLHEQGRHDAHIHLETTHA